MKELTELIKEITPHYNNYKQQRGKINGTELLLIMWDIGDLIKKYIEETKVPPHNLFRQIYGKSEGKKNINQKSYIAREFLGRCYRVRYIFHDKENIKTLLPNVIDITSFREAMPFFDNPNYKLNEKDFKELILLLNSKKRQCRLSHFLILKRKDSIIFQIPELKI